MFTVVYRCISCHPSHLERCVSRAGRQRKLHSRVPDECISFFTLFMSPTPLYHEVFFFVVFLKIIFPNNDAAAPPNFVHGWT